MVILNIIGYLLIWTVGAFVFPIVALTIYGWMTRFESEEGGIVAAVIFFIIYLIATGVVLITL